MDNAQASCALSMMFVLFTNNLSYIEAAQLWLMWGWHQGKYLDPTRLLDTDHGDSG